MPKPLCGANVTARPEERSGKVNARAKLKACPMGSKIFPSLHPKPQLYLVVRNNLINERNPNVMDVAREMMPPSHVYY